MEVNPSSSSNERQSDVVDRFGGLQEDVSAELIVINDVRGVVSLIANDEIIVNTSLGLNITQIWFNDVDEVRSGDLIVQFKQLSFSSTLKCLFNSQEQTTDVDSVECRSISESSLVAKEQNTKTRSEHNRVDSGLHRVDLFLPDSGCMPV